MAANKRRRKRTEDANEEEELVKKKEIKLDEENDASVKCGLDFFAVSCEELAKKLLGCLVCRKMVDGNVCKGRIVETEAYLGPEDKAAHSYRGKRTPRNEAMYMRPGTCYVYSIYGIHSCMNISSSGEGAAVLIRALEPVEGIEQMRERRSKCKKDHELCQGPAKLCQAMDISKEHNMVDMTVSMEIWVEPGGSSPADEVVTCKRIGIDYAEEWKDKLLRYYINNNKCISKHASR
jgi:DNA-3-methyladenine glycosylase